MCVIAEKFMIIALSSISSIHIRSPFYCKKMKIRRCISPHKNKPNNKNGNFLINISTVGQIVVRAAFKDFENIYIYRWEKGKNTIGK